MTIFISTNDFPDRSQINLYLQQANPKKLVDEGFLSETMYRILTYWLEKHSEDETVQIMETLRHEKIRQIYLIKELLSNSKCIRHQLVSFFGQTITKNPRNCCTVCGLKDDEVLSVRSIEVLSDNGLNWNERLALIFNIEQP